MNREFTDKQITRQVHKVIVAAGIDKSFSVTSIRKASITKAINQGASK
jgi:site-specific recombinase XerD